MPADAGAAEVDAARGELHLVFPAEPWAVRRALEEVLDGLNRLGLDADDLGVAEIVLAEVLNNIVEHAYRREGGDVEVSARLNGAALAFDIFDDGVPMPGGAIPSGRLEPGEVARDLPEGGFGWHLIRALSSGLDYGREGGREGGRNRLRFALIREQKGPLG